MRRLKLVAKAIFAGLRDELNTEHPEPRNVQSFLDSFQTEKEFVAEDGSVDRTAQAYLATIDYSRFKRSMEQKPAPMVHTASASETTQKQVVLAAARSSNAAPAPKQSLPDAWATSTSSDPVARVEEKSANCKELEHWDTVKVVCYLGKLLETVDGAGL
ncbi:MAG: hypothetical protein C5B49_01335 [Bdellovibrio sp.]|nr:MAG: hypothetical protein C5B49_01335 [Bdellovibrio sp.]